MSEFEKWFEDQDFYTNMRFIHGDKLFDKDDGAYRVLPVQMTYLAWLVGRAGIKEMDEVIKLQDADLRKHEKQIESLKEHLNNMETCYIEKKKQVEGALHILDELYRKGLFKKPTAVSDAINILRGGA